MLGFRLEKLATLVRAWCLRLASFPLSALLVVQQVRIAPHQLHVDTQNRIVG